MLASRVCIRSYAVTAVLALRPLPPPREELILWNERPATMNAFLRRARTHALCRTDKRVKFKCGKRWKETERNGRMCSPPFRRSPCAGKKGGREDQQIFVAFAIFRQQLLFSLSSLSSASIFLSVPKTCQMYVSSDDDSSFSAPLALPTKSRSSPSTHTHAE